MTTTAPGAGVRRVLVMALTSKDARTTRGLLESLGIPVDVCQTFEDLIAELRDGAAALLIPEEAIAHPSTRSALAALVEHQPPWSDLPILVLVRPGARSRTSDDAVRTLGNVTLLERPVQVATLVSAVRTALRARERQMQIQELLRERERTEQLLLVADQRKDEFLATLGHELRNPLAPLVTGLQLLKTSGVDDPRVLRVTPVMERQLQHLVRLVDDLLEVSRVTRGLVDIQRESVDLVLAVRSALEISRPMVEAAGHHLAVDLPSEPVVVTGDAVRLTQVFANLLTNAAKYTDSGGRVTVSLTRDEHQAIVSVRDSGIGIAASQLESIFDMFMQVDRSNRRAQGGLGIGLTLVRSLVSLHHGRVRARSAGPGAGSEFVVELPVRGAVAAPVRAPRGLAPFPPRRVLIVDDNRDAADTLAALLDALGVIVGVARSGQEALDRLPGFDPDAVVLDVGMPGMDGYEAARRIRATPCGRTVTLIALTGWGQDHDIGLARAAGFDHHLVKPPQLDRLRAMLSDIPERHVGARETARSAPPPV